MASRTETDSSPGPNATAADLGDHARAVKEDLRGLSRAAKGVAQEKLGDAKHKAAEYYEQGKQKVSKVEDQIEGYIREKPLKSVLIAAGAGMLVGFLISRR